MHLFDDVEENPTSKHVEAGAHFARPLGIDLIVSVGGGKRHATAPKGINFILTNGGTMADYKGFGKATKPMLPSIGVPTTSGTGSEAQSFALIADAKTHMKMACGDRKAAFHVTVLDPEVTVSQPGHVTALTGIDAVAHALESYVSTARNPGSQMFAREAWKLLESNLELVLKEPTDLEARGAMQMGAFLAGAAIENSMLGVCHAACAQSADRSTTASRTARLIAHSLAARVVRSTTHRRSAPFTASCSKKRISPTAYRADPRKRSPRRDREASMKAAGLYDDAIGMRRESDRSCRSWRKKPTSNGRPGSTTRPVAEPDLVGLFEAAM